MAPKADADVNLTGIEAHYRSGNSAHYHEILRTAHRKLMTDHRSLIEELGLLSPSSP